MWGALPYFEVLSDEPVCLWRGVCEVASHLRPLHMHLGVQAEPAHLLVTCRARGGQGGQGQGQGQGQGLGFSAGEPAHLLVTCWGVGVKGRAGARVRSRAQQSWSQ